MGEGGHGLALSAGMLVLGAVLLLAGAAAGKEPRPAGKAERSRSVHTLGPVLRIGETARFQIGYRRFEAGPACTALRQGTVVRFVWGRACPSRLLVGTRQQVCDVACTYWNPVEVRFTNFIPPWALRHGAGDPKPESLGTTFVPGSRMHRPAPRMRLPPSPPAVAPPTPPAVAPPPAPRRPAVPPLKNAPGLLPAPPEIIGPGPRRGLRFTPNPNARPPVPPRRSPAAPPVLPSPSAPQSAP